MSVRWSFLLLLVVLLALDCYAQGNVGESQNPCRGAATCSECIQRPTCAWCFKENITISRRCFQLESATQSCEEGYYFNPSNEMRTLRSVELRKANSSYQMEAVQIKPQHISLKLRVAETHRFNMYYAQADDYPVDLYYLMDLSKSMEDDKEKLSKLGNILAAKMQSITSNFRLGFGSFVDKVVMPYVSTVPSSLLEPCPGCAAPYGFHNVMPLSRDTAMFAEQVRRARVSGNLDAPEGGFDAIMQAVVCGNKIGWRKNARRLLVFSTDAGFHYAGDGKLGGIVKPNDGSCHLDENGNYTHSTIQDYPSISQINMKVKENAINVIFAVTAEQINVYNKLQKSVEGSTSGTLSNDSSNVVELVQDQYNKITSSVKMSHNASGAVELKLYSRCMGTGPVKETQTCDGVKVMEPILFEAELKVKYCPKDRKQWKQRIEISPVGIQEFLYVDLELLCDCDCERPGSRNYEENSPVCKNHGTYMCGVCKCNPPYIGNNCDCDSENMPEGTDSYVSNCRAENDTEDCSGRGECICGQCRCLEHPNIEFSGEYCQCSNVSCGYGLDNKMCSGNGECVCGECKCITGWTGSACECTTKVNDCIDPEDPNKQVCSGFGDCHCGKCICGNETRAGKYCQHIQYPSGFCLEFRDCVQCMVYETGKLSKEECAANCTFQLQRTETIKADEKKGEFPCTYYDEDDCRFSYIYTYLENGTVLIRAQEERECPPEIYILGIVLGVIAAIVFIGLALLLLWKLLTTIHDRREFAKFEKERMMAKWDTGENPIYKQATSTFKNPTYAGK